MFDDSFIRYFKDNPDGYKEVMKAVNEQVPEDIREGIRERFNKLYEQSKKGDNEKDFSDTGYACRTAGKL